MYPCFLFDLSCIFWNPCRTDTATPFQRPVTSHWQPLVNPFAGLSFLSALFTPFFFVPIPAKFSNAIFFLLPDHLFFFSFFSFLFGPFFPLIFFFSHCEVKIFCPGVLTCVDLYPPPFGPRIFTLSYDLPSERRLRRLLLPFRFHPLRICPGPHIIPPSACVLPVFQAFHGDYNGPAGACHSARVTLIMSDYLWRRLAPLHRVTTCGSLDWVGLSNLGPIYSFTVETLPRLWLVVLCERFPFSFSSFTVWFHGSDYGELCFYKRIVGHV